MTPQEAKVLKAAILEAYPDEQFLFADGFETAMLGVVLCYTADPVVCYDYETCIEILMKDMTREDAVEYFDFNVIGAYVGKKTPFFLNRVSEYVELVKMDKKKRKKKAAVG
jgi:hypothetical protein